MMKEYETWEKIHDKKSKKGSETKMDWKSRKKSRTRRRTRFHFQEKTRWYITSHFTTWDSREEEECILSMKPAFESFCRRNWRLHRKGDTITWKGIYSKGQRLSGHICYFKYCLLFFFYRLSFPASVAFEGGSRERVSLLKREEKGIFAEYKMNDMTSFTLCFGLRFTVLFSLIQFNVIFVSWSWSLVSKWNGKECSSWKDCSCETRLGRRLAYEFESSISLSFFSVSFPRIICSPCDSIFLWFFSLHFNSYHPRVKSHHRKKRAQSWSSRNMDMTITMIIKSMMMTTKKKRKNQRWLQY